MLRALTSGPRRCGAVQAASCGRGGEPSAARAHTQARTHTPATKPQIPGFVAAAPAAAPQDAVGSVVVRPDRGAQGRSGRSQDYRGRAMDGVSAIPSRALLHHQQRRRREEKLKGQDRAARSRSRLSVLSRSPLRSRPETHVAAPASTCRQASHVGYVSSVERSAKPQPSSPSFVPLPVRAGRCQLACEARACAHFIVPLDRRRSGSGIASSRRAVLCCASLR